MTTAGTMRPGPTPPVAGERKPPQDLDAERALLGSMLMSRDAIGDVVTIISRSESAWFYLPAHQRIFEILLDLYEDPSKPIDLIVMREELRRRELLEEIGGVDYLVQLAESFADWANAEHYARLVRGKGMLRDLIRCVGEINDLAYAGLAEPGEILEESEQRFFAVAERRVSGQAVPIREPLRRLAQQIERHDQGIITGLGTGFVNLDQLTTGFQRGDLVIVAGRPSMGKTALGLTIAHHAAVRDRTPVVFFSLEMSVDQLAQRLLCAEAHFDMQRLRRRMLSEEDVRDLLGACDELDKAPLYVDDTPGMTPLELRAKARRLKQRHDIQAVFVDYLQLMHLPGAESRQVEIATISRHLKSLARELKVPVIAMAQLNRKPADRKDNRPMMSDLRESGAIEQDADVILLLHREEYYEYDPQKREEVKGQAELIIAKQRNGPTDVVPLHFHKSFAIFTPAAVEAEPPPGTYRDDAPF
ncbi:MAG TPA: replicative DNA helicase [Phycisphaerae bacterium]|nr:replicative DNA helicase [Phycisphaerae bacterium]HNU45245.1 replicative DNA helicase [Phycisphaerae bacterium]